ncbi:MAG: hypothetical protein ACI4EK_02535 [Wujia sp.]
MDIKKIICTYYSYIVSACKKKNVIAGFLLGTAFSLRTSVMYLRFAEGHTVQTTESFLMGLSSKGNAMLLIFGCMVALADAPFVDGNAFILLHRVGKKNWYAAVWLYMSSLCMMYYLLCFGVSCMPMLFNGYAENMWSQTFLRISKGTADLLTMYGLVAPDFAIVQMDPYMVLVCSLISIVMYTTCLCGVMFVFNVSTGKKATGGIAALCLHIISLYVGGNLIMGYNMTQWSLLRHGIFVSYGHLGIPDFHFSYVYMILAVYILFMLGEISIHWVDIIACEKEEVE